nr:hypothetical protein [Rhizobium redzepovicii]
MAVLAIAEFSPVRYGCGRGRGQLQCHRSTGNDAVFGIAQPFHDETPAIFECQRGERRVLIGYPSSGDIETGYDVLSATEACRSARSPTVVANWSSRALSPEREEAPPSSWKLSR